MPRQSLSVCVICFNEEDRLRDCLESVKWADEIVVVDSKSTDRSAEVAREFTEKIIQRPWPGYVAQKNFALEQARSDWILSIDADERVSPDLRREIEAILEAPSDDVAAYAMPRHTFYLGRWINHGGWYPDPKVRLVRRGLAAWKGDDPHDKLVARGRIGRLRGDLVHHTYRNFSHQLRVIDSFSNVVIEKYVDAYTIYARGAILPLMLIHPPMKFFECYVWKLGILDGMPGFIISAASAFYVFAKYAKAWEYRHVKP